MIPSHMRAAAVIVLVTSMCLSAQSGTPLRFDVTSVKPAVTGTAPNFGVRPGGRFAAVNLPLLRLIGMAHQINNDFHIVGGPDWIRTARYDIEAKAPEGIVMGALASDGPPSPVQQMLASLLADRFGLKAHYEKREMPAYELRTAFADARLGPRLKPSPPGIDCDALRTARKLQRPSSPPPPGEAVPCLILIYPGRVVGGTMPLAALASFLTSQVSRTVIDRTSFTTSFDFDLTWVPENLTADAFTANQAAPGSATAPTGPSLMTAVQEQLGLKLEPTTAPTGVLVIDAASPPSPN